MMRIDDVVVFIGIKFRKNLFASNQFPAGGNRRFEFDKRRPLFICTHNFGSGLSYSLINAILAMMRPIR
jgi:hypothetical protein